MRGFIVTTLYVLAVVLLVVSLFLCFRGGEWEELRIYGIIGIIYCPFLVGTAKVFDCAYRYHEQWLVNMYVKLAEDGDAEAMYKLSVYFKQGENNTVGDDVLTNDYIEKYWLKKSQEGGYVPPKRPESLMMKK